MELADVLGRLDDLGAGKSRLVMGPLRALGKEIKLDHDLALDLWATGRVDARLLATMVMVPKRLSPGEAEGLLAAVAEVQVLDELTYKVVAGAPFADDLGRKWLDAGPELTRRAGWNLLVSKVMSKGQRAEGCGAILDTIESRCKTAPVREAESMMRCLVEIGVRFPEHRARALDIGTRWGLLDDRPVPRGCTPFYAPAWIEAILRRKDG